MPTVTSTDPQPGGPTRVHVGPVVVIGADGIQRATVPEEALRLGWDGFSPVLRLDAEGVA